MSVTQISPADKTFSEIGELADSLCKLIKKAATEGGSLYDAEKATLALVLQIGGKAMDALFQLQGDGDLGETLDTKDGPLRRSQAPRERRLRTIFGEHRFSQFVYSRGAKRKISLYPIDARLSLSERVSSYLLEEFSQLFCIESAFGQAANHLATVLGQKLSMNTLEAISQSLGTAAKTYAEALPPPRSEEEAALLVATMDAKGVPLIRADCEKVKAFQTRKLRPGNRRMATLASVYSVDPYMRTPEQIVAALFRDPSPRDKIPRPPAKAKRYSVHFPECYQDGEDTLMSTGAIEACCWLSSEVSSRRKDHQLLLLLIDGDHRFWDTASDHLAEDRIEILDILHVSSYVWKAAAVLCHSQQEREAFTRSRLLTILQGGVKSVIRSLRRIATSRGLKGDARKNIATITAYFEAHAQRMRYDEFLRAGYPIATGVIEGLPPSGQGSNGAKRDALDSARRQSHAQQPRHP